MKYSRSLAGLLLAGLVGACTTTHGTTPVPQPVAGSVSVYCGTLIDGFEDAPRHDVTVAIRTGHIETITDGRLAPGYLSDLIAVDGDPLIDISLLQHVDHVIKGGQVLR